MLPSNVEFFRLLRTMPAAELEGYTDSALTIAATFAAVFAERFPREHDAWTLRVQRDTVQQADAVIVRVPLV